MAGIEFLRNDPAARPVAAGTTIFSVGDHGDSAFVVLDGAIELELQGRILEVVEHGGIFGEMALIDEGERSATARANIASVVVPIDAKRFGYLVQNAPYFAVEVMRIMARRLRRMDASLESSGRGG